MVEHLFLFGSKNLASSDFWTAYMQALKATDRLPKGIDFASFLLFATAKPANVTVNSRLVEPQPSIEEAQFQLYNLGDVPVVKKHFYAPVLGSFFSMYATYIDGLVPKAGMEVMLDANRKLVDRIRQDLMATTVQLPEYEMAVQGGLSTYIKPRYFSTRLDQVSAWADQTILQSENMGIAPIKLEVTPSLKLAPEIAESSRVASVATPAAATMLTSGSTPPFLYTTPTVSTDDIPATGSRIANAQSMESVQEAEAIRHEIATVTEYSVTIEFQGATLVDIEVGPWREMQLMNNFASNGTALLNQLLLVLMPRVTITATPEVINEIASATTRDARTLGVANLLFGFGRLPHSTMLMAEHKVTDANTVTIVSEDPRPWILGATYRDADGF